MQVPSNSSATSAERIEDELAQAKALELIVSPEVSEGMRRNLQLLNQHFEIVAAALDELGGEPT